MGLHGWTAVRALPYLDASARDQMHEAVKTYMAGLDKRLDETPFGVPPSLGGWGGSGAVVDMGIRMYFLHKAFPDLVGPEYTLRAVNYVLGTHPVSSTSYVAGVGTVSKTKTYSNNRGNSTHTFRARSFRDTSSSSRIFRSASTTTDFYGSRMKLWWPARQAGSWPATLRRRLSRNQSKTRTRNTKASLPNQGCVVRPNRLRCSMARNRKARQPKGIRSASGTDFSMLFHTCGYLRSQPSVCSSISMSFELRPHRQSEPRNRERTGSVVKDMQPAFVIRSLIGFCR